jgi:hypothetical protein
MRRNTASSVLSSETLPVTEASAHACATYQSLELKLNHPPGFAARYSTREKTHS